MRGVKVILKLINNQSKKKKRKEDHNRKLKEV